MLAASDLVRQAIQCVARLCRRPCCDGQLVQWSEARLLLQETTMATGQEPIADADASTPLTPTHPARALIGWMVDEEALLWLAGRQAGLAPNPAHAVLASRLRAGVAARPAFGSTDGTVGPIPNELTEYAEAFRTDPRMAQLFATSAARVVMVDLNKVCAAQPSVMTEAAINRVEAIASGDLLALAAITIPLPASSPLSPRFDQAKMAWTIGSPNPNLRITGMFGAPQPSGDFAVGFLVRVMTSQLSVGLYHGRFILRDGYHRAYGLLSRGISMVPAILTEHATFAELGLPQGLLGQDAYLGDRPPLLPDYLDDAVAASIRMPITQKLVVVQGMELTT
jgi:hypothetical protein